MKKQISLLLIIFFIILNLYSKERNKIIENNVQEEFILKDTISKNYVPDAETAKKIAEAIWLPIYGEKIFKQKPYNAVLKDSVWVVRGLIPYPYRNDLNFRGGTAYIEIRKKDCKILKVTHGK